MDIKILGTGCATCQKLEQLTSDAIESVGADFVIDKVTDPGEIAGWGVMSTPALVIDGDVVFSGRLPSEEQIAALLVPS
jgi:small redox-active disulfide protein 2